MEVGRRVYYDPLTGDVVQDCGERSGDVTQTTQEQDFEVYPNLQPYEQGTLGILELEYGTFRKNFAKYLYHIDLTKNPIDETAIVWDQL